MSDKINGRTPEEIKRGLECCDVKHSCFECPYRSYGRKCPEYLAIDVLDLIQQLERERDEARNDLDALNYANTELHSAYEAMKRERDAAIKDIVRTCQKCKHRENRFLKDGQLDDLCGTCIYNNMCNWQWRGVPQEVE